MNFHAVNAKLRAMRAGLFKYADYEALCRMGSVESVGNRLREQLEYKKALAGLEDTALHRSVVEERITLSLYDDYARICHFLFDKSIREYMSAIFMQYEIDFIKLLLCMIFDERDIPYTLGDLDILFGQDRKIDLAKLVSAKTVPEFIEMLQGTDIYTVLAESYEHQSSLFALERQLDLYYYLQLWKKQKNVSHKESREIMTRIKGTEIDLRNIMWIYRLKHYYNMSDANVYADLIPINYRLKPAAINRMVESRDDNALLNEIASSPYGDVFEDFTMLEQSYARAMRKVYAAETQKHPDSLAAAVGYIFDKEQEIHNITTVLEGVRYAMPAGEIMRYLCI